MRPHSCRDLCFFSFFVFPQWFCYAFGEASLGFSVFLVSPMVLLSILLALVKALSLSLSLRMRGESSHWGFYSTNKMCGDSLQSDRYQTHWENKKNWKTQRGFTKSIAKLLRKQKKTKKTKISATMGSLSGSASIYLLSRVFLFFWSEVREIALEHQQHGGHCIEGDRGWPRQWPS